MRDRFLLGGASEAANPTRRRNAETPAAPPVVSIPFIAMLVIVGATFVGLGMWRVHTVFQLRDDQMETRRLQELTALRRDRLKALDSRLANLRRSEILLTTGTERFGLSSPTPEDIRTLTVPNETQRRWREAAARTSLSNDRKEDH